MTSRVQELLAELGRDEAYATGRRAFPRTVTPDDAAAIALALSAEVDRGADARARAAAKDGETLACGRGCNGCCEEPVVVYRPESLAVAAWLARPENAPARRGFEDAYPSWRARVGDGPERLATMLAEGAAGYEEAHRAEWRKRVLCAFNQGGDCVIYPVRPATCRNAHAVGTSERCSGDSPVPATRLAWVPLDRFIATAGRLVRAAHGAVGGPTATRRAPRPAALCEDVHALLAKNG